jgi:hypothetical protein
MSHDQTAGATPRGPIGAELAQMPREASNFSQMIRLAGGAVKNFFEISSENPNRTALGMRMLGGLAVTFGAVEYFLVGSQSTGELIGDSIFELSGAALIGASYLAGRQGVQ